MEPPAEKLDYQTPANRRSEARRRRRSLLGGPEVAGLVKPFVCACVGWGIWPVALAITAALGLPERVGTLAIAATLPVTLVGVAVSFRRVDSEGCLGTLGGLLLLPANGLAALLSVYALLFSVGLVR